MSSQGSVSDWAFGLVIWQVLFLVEPIDEVALMNLANYKDKKFVDISKDDLELGMRLTSSGPPAKCLVETIPY